MYMQITWLNIVRFECCCKFKNKCSQHLYQIPNT
jgi:hypothetical protein